MKNNLNLIIGEDKELINFYLQDIINKINNDNKIYYDLNNDAFASIIDEASMISLFSNIKIIIANNLDISKISDNDIEYLKKYIDNLNKDIYIILIAQKIDARLKNYKIFKDYFNIIDVSKIDNNNQILDYVNKKIKDSGYKINNYDLEYSDRIILLKDNIISFDGSYDEFLNKINMNKVGFKNSWENEISNKLIMYDLIHNVHDNIEDIVGELCD